MQQVYTDFTQLYYAALLERLKHMVYIRPRVLKRKGIKPKGIKPKGIKPKGGTYPRFYPRG